ncbi:MAG TPA: DUF1552 domain-containing protein [Polyangiaceae bacterium]|jgi:hypothetical protein|nr:DUF1552 domain-containing protein [Polyangiaceae bacterium]
MIDHEGRAPAFNRRRFLTALGASAFAMLGPRSARAAGSSVPPPLAFIGVYAPHGCAYELWKPGPDFDLRTPDSSLSPFDDVERFGRSFKQNLLVIDGLDLAAGIEVGTVGHDASRVLFTGSGISGKNASIDQYLASDCSLGAQTPVTSLVLAVGNDSTDLGANVSYSALGLPVPKWIDPSRVFDELFGQSLTPKGREQLALERRLGQSVLDFARTDLQRLNARANAAERMKLEQHATALREIEKRLSPIERACSPGERPNPSAFPKLKSFGGGEPYFEAITQLHVELLARAICCDMTRFATLMLADLSRTNLYAELPSDVHTDVAHRYTPRRTDGSGDVESWHRLAIQNRHSHLQVAKLLKLLDEGGALERSLVYVSSDMGDPSRHSSRNVPTLLFGGASAPFAFGRHLDLRSAKADAMLPHNRLLVSLIQAFGVERDSFGTSHSQSTTTGRLSELSIT